jgi:hypothetical protein
VTLRELAALARRQVVAIALVALITLGIAYSFKRTPPTFQDTGTIALVSPGPNPYASQFSNSLIITGESIVKWIDGPQGQAKLQQVGAGTGFAIGLVNFSNQEYPYYAEPYLTASSTASNPAMATQIFLAGTRVFNEKLAAVQAHVHKAHLITTKTIGGTDPIIALGSSKRSYAGLGILGVIAAYQVANFCNRRRIRIRLPGFSGRKGRITERDGDPEEASAAFSGRPRVRLAWLLPIHR